MNQDMSLPEPIDGYPSFVRRAADASGVNWWSPIRKGDDDADFLAGCKHLEAALDLVREIRDPSAVDFYRRLMSPPIMADVYPAGILTNVVWAMRVSGPIERGFLHSLAMKAVAGRSPPNTTMENDYFADDDRYAEEYAQACLDLARITGSPDLIFDELISAVDQTFYSGTPAAFVWVVCLAAAAGALN